MKMMDVLSLVFFALSLYNLFEPLILRFLPDRIVKFMTRWKKCSPGNSVIRSYARQLNAAVKYTEDRLNSLEKKHNLKAGSLFRASIMNLNADQATAISSNLSKLLQRMKNISDELKQSMLKIREVEKDQQIIEMATRRIDDCDKVYQDGYLIQNFLETKFQNGEERKENNVPISAICLKIVSLQISTNQLTNYLITLEEDYNVNTNSMVESFLMRITAEQAQNAITELSTLSANVELFSFELRQLLTKQTKPNLDEKISKYANRCVDISNEQYMNAIIIKHILESCFSNRECDDENALI